MVERFPALHRAPDCVGIAQVALRELAAKRFGPWRGAARDYAHLVTCLDQQRHQGAAEEAGGAGDEDLHFAASVVAASRRRGAREILGGGAPSRSASTARRTWRVI